MLFLDELCEFRRDALEALRAPLETGWVSIARAGGLAAAALPVHARRRGEPLPVRARRGRPASAAARRSRSQRYQARLSGALADRIDILAAIRQPSAEEIGGAPGEASAAVRERVGAARERQDDRLGAGPLQRRDDAGRGARVRARATRPRRCSPTPTRAAGSAAAPTTGCCGWRGPIADLAGTETIEREQMAQALQLRRRDYE